jgi:hypothetical protein
VGENSTSRIFGLFEYYLGLLSTLIPFKEVELPATISSSARTVSVGFDPALAQLGYGRAIWLMGAAAGLPDGSYGFNGNRGQYALIVPSAPTR